MAIIKQIAVYDQNYNQNNHWKIDDIGVNDASNVELGSNTTIRNQSNVLESLLALDGDLSTIETNFNDKVDKSGDTITGSLSFKNLNDINNSAIINFNGENMQQSGLVIQGSKTIANNQIVNILSLTVDSNGEPKIAVVSNGITAIDTAWRNAIKAFGKYGDEEHYGSINLQIDPENSPQGVDVINNFKTAGWLGINFQDKGKWGSGYIRGFSGVANETLNGVTFKNNQTGLQLRGLYPDVSSINPTTGIPVNLGYNNLMLGVDSNGDPTVHISAGNQNDDLQNKAQAAWRKAITGSSKTAVVMNVSFQTITLSSTENFPANDTKVISLTANAPNDSTYDWTAAIAVQGWTHSHQNKLLVLNYTNKSVQNNQCTVNATIQNPTNNSLQDLVSFRLIWFAVFGGTNNI